MNLVEECLSEGGELLLRIFTRVVIAVLALIFISGLGTVLYGCFWLMKAFIASLP